MGQCAGMSPERVCRLSPQPVAESRELLVADDIDEFEVRSGEPARKQRRSATEGYRRDPDKHLVQETGISKLPHEITTGP
jgi:hypothetical protein